MAEPGLIRASDYVLKEVTIYSSDGNAVDITKLIVELNLYEDVWTPTMSGSVLMGDSLDLISSFKYHGNEFITVTIDKPTLNNPIEKTFRIYKCAERTLGASGLQNYTLYFCSEEMFLSSQIFIAKSYKGLTIDMMVKDLLSKMKVPASKINIIEPCQGNFDLIIPRMNPLEAIAWLTPRAYNSNRNLYFFFENRDGFNFVSYETLIQRGVYDNYTMSVKLDTSPEKNSNKFNLLNIIEDFNVLKSMRSGSFSSSIASFDVLSRKYDVTNFNVTQIANTSVLNEYVAANDFRNRLGNNLYSSLDNMLKYIIINDSDPTVNPSRIRRWLPQTACRLGLLNSFKMVGVIPGDVLIKVGMVINVTIPKMEIQDKSFNYDKMRTGKYFISSVHHKFVNDISTTIIELLSDTISDATLPPASGSPTLQQVINQ